MSAVKTARTKKAAKPARKAVVVAVTKKAPRKAKPAPVELTRSEIVSAAMLENSEARTAARSKRDGVPAKHLVYTEFYKALVAKKELNVEALQRKYAGEIKPTTITSWLAAFRNQSNLPSN